MLLPVDDGDLLVLDGVSVVSESLARPAGSGDPKMSPTPLPFSPAHALATSTAPTFLLTEASPAPSDLPINPSRLWIPHGQ